MKVLIVEDEIWSLELLHKMLVEIDDEFEILKASNVDEAVKLIESEKPNLIFLDIKLGNENSFDIFERISDKSINVVFITSYEEFAIKAFAVNAIDYILKPYTKSTLQNAIQKYKLFREKVGFSHSDKLLIYKDNCLKTINISEIVKIKADRQYTHIYLKGETEKIVSSKSLNHFEEILFANKFIRCHNSFIVNADFVDGVKKALNSFIILINGEMIPISRNKKKEVFDFFLT